MNGTDYLSPESCATLPGLFLARATKDRGRTAYRWFDREAASWRDLTWGEMLAMVARRRGALAAEGLAPGERVAVMLANGPEWVAFEQAAMSLGLIVVPLYANDRPENIAYILDNTETRVLLCPGDHYRERLAAAVSGVPSLQRIVTCLPEVEGGGDGKVAPLRSWLPAAPPAAEPFAVTARPTATIVFTSGTTGPPKGVMLSHDNILQNCASGLSTMAIYPEDIFLSFLPLSHMLERTAGYYMPMMAGSTVVFARSIPDLGEDLVSQRPTVLVAVPRIFERIHAGIVATLEAGPKIRAALFHRAVSVGWQDFLHRQGRGRSSLALLLRPLLDRLVGAKVRDKFGGRLRLIISGGAPLSAEIARVFIGLGIPVHQGYGLTETSPVISVNRAGDNRPETVGPPLPGLEVRIADSGELLVRGPAVMQGYWRNEEATARTIDEQGWLHTGDKAVLEDGHLRIVGRLKEIIVLSNGEKVAPGDMEMAIAMDPLFEQSMVLGEGRPYLTLIAVLHRPLWEELAGQLGVSAEPSSLVLPQVKKAVLGRVEKLLRHFPGFVFIKDLTLSLQPWTVDDGLLTPTLKLKRNVVEKRHKAEISRMYQR